MKKLVGCVLMALVGIFLLTPYAFAQGGSMNGATGKPASINAVQVAGRDPSSNLQALKVDTDGSLLVSASATTPGSIFWTESTSAPGASTTVTGSTRANGGTAGGTGTRYNSFVASAYVDVTGGTLYIDKSVDGGSVWRQVTSISAAANTDVSLKVPVTAAHYRARFGNGATPATVFALTSSYATN